MYIHIWIYQLNQLSHFAIHQKLTQHCTWTIFQYKIIKTKFCMWWEYLLKIPAAKNMLLGAKGLTFSSNLKTNKNQIKIKLRCLIKRTCVNALMCKPVIRLTFSSLNCEVQLLLSNNDQHKVSLRVLTIEKLQKK